MSNIHQTAIIEEGAEISQSATIGAYSIIGADVKIGENVKIESHVVIGGDTSIGDGTHIFPFASIGLAPQDLKFNGEKTTLEIGKNNTIREHVTMNPGTEGGGSVTKIGDNCLFMMASHIAHDCVVGNNVILANNATLAGHVQIGDYAIIGGLSAIHQFVRVGEHAIIGGMSGIESDIIPFGAAMGERANLSGLNLKGMKRRGFKREDIHALRGAYKEIFSNEGSIDDRLSNTLEKYSTSEIVKSFIGFIQENNSRSICQPKYSNKRNESA